MIRAASIRVHVSDSAASFCQMVYVAKAIEIPLNQTRQATAVKLDRVNARFFLARWWCVGH